MIYSLKNRLIYFMEEVIREVEYGSRVVDKNIPSLYKQEEED